MRLYPAPTAKLIPDVGSEWHAACRLLPLERDKAMNGAEDCRAYVEHLQHEHGRLHQLLLEIGHEVEKLGQAGPPSGVFDHLAQRLTDLRQQLQTHFAEEEAGGCLEEAVTRCPSLSDDSKAIVAEHPVLDRMLEQLLVQTRKQAVSSSDFQRDYQAFAKKLHAHEAAENRLLQMAFGSDATDYDVEGDA
jgi:Hemerythrin HHE cation binding domain